MAEPMLGFLGPEVMPEEETFLLFSQTFPDQNLGIVDASATTIDLDVGGRDLSIQQSPTVLSSKRARGTTGAVIWKVTPPFAAWLASPSNVFFQSGILSQSSAVLELGCGVSAVVALALGPLVSRYTLTDQPYVSKIVEQNLQKNRSRTTKPTTGTKSSSSRKSKPPPSSQEQASSGNIRFQALDWEQDQVTASLTGDLGVTSFDLVLACDCIYNEALVKPFVETCVDVCSLRLKDSASPTTSRQCACVVAQQLRDPEIFEAWLREFSRAFHAWRIPDEHLLPALRNDSYGSFRDYSYPFGLSLGLKDMFQLLDQVL